MLACANMFAEYANWDLDILAYWLNTKTEMSPGFHTNQRVEIQFKPVWAGPPGEEFEGRSPSSFADRGRGWSVAALLHKMQQGGVGWAAALRPQALLTLPFP